MLAPILSHLSLSCHSIELLRLNDYYYLSFCYHGSESAGHCKCFVFVPDSVLEIDLYSPRSLRCEAEGLLLVSLVDGCVWSYLHVLEGDVTPIFAIAGKVKSVSQIKLFAKMTS